MKISFLAACALALSATTALATPPPNTPNVAAEAIANVTVKTEAEAVAGALSNASAVNGPNTAINGPNTLVGGSNTNLVNGGDNRATVGNVSSSSGPSTSSVIAPVSSTNINTPHQGQVQGQDQDQHQAITGSGNSSSGSSSNQQQSLTDSSNHVQTATTGASTSTANGNGAGQTTTFTQNYQAQKRAPVASAYAAPSQIGSLVCGITRGSIAIQLPGFGGSGNTANIDTGCERRSTADVFARLGMQYEACLIMVHDPVAAATGLTEASCVRPAIVVAADPAPAVPLPTEPAHAVTEDAGATSAVPIHVPVIHPVPVLQGERHIRRISPTTGGQCKLVKVCP